MAKKGVNKRPKKKKANVPVLREGTAWWLEQTARDLVEKAVQRNILLRVAGSVGFRLCCGVLADCLMKSRVYKDLDFGGSRNQVTAIRGVFAESNWEEKEGVTQYSEHRRMEFHLRSKGIKADVFLDELRMSHTVPFSGRLDVCCPSLSPADLLLTNLQRKDQRDQDRSDALGLLSCYGATDDDTGINRKRISDVLSRDWGFYERALTNLSALKEAVKRSCLNLEQQREVVSRVDALVAHVQQSKKSIIWRLRRTLGHSFRSENPVEVFSGF